jgi:TRAP-type C4-dicarboxylate transport system substrate-binding protein
VSTGTLHANLVAMWEAVAAETNGRVETTVFAENNKLAGGDPVALKMLIAGEIQFFTLMGGIIGTVAPVAEAQQVPFAFKSAADAHRTIDGPLGRYIAQEMAAKSIYLFPVAGFDNGMRQVTTVKRPVKTPEDLAGVKIRVPPGQMVFDTFQAFGAEPVTTPANGIYAALESGKVDAQENPLAVAEGFRLYELIQICQHDQSHVVRIQSDGASADLAAFARRHSSNHRAQRRQIRASSTRRAGAAQRRLARDLRAAGHPVE